MQMLRVFWESAIAVDEDARKLDEAHMPLCRSGELSGLWSRAGLHDIREQPIHIDTRFDSFEDYWQPFLLGQAPAGAYASRLDSIALQRLGTK